MKRKLPQYLIISVSFFILTSLISFCPVVFADTGWTDAELEEYYSGSPASSSSSASTSASGLDFPTSAETGLSDIGIKEILINILEWLLGVVGIVALIGFVISGSIYILSSGDDDTAKKAKIAMKNSIIGIVVALGAFVVIQAVDAMLRGMSF